MSDAVLGIHSNVRPGMIDPATGRPFDPGLIDGHGWLTLTRDGKTTTYGLWPDDNPRIADAGLGNGRESDIRVGMEDKYNAAASRYYRLSPEQAKVLDAKLKENVTWGYTNNCSSWASETLTAVTGERINADEPYTAGVVETPRVLGESIHQLERKQPTSRGAPATPPPQKGTTSNSLSDASGASGMQEPDASRHARLSVHAQNLLSDSEREVRQLAHSHGLPWDQGMDNTVVAVAQQARADGLTGINLVNVKNGQIRFGQYDGQLLKEGGIDARVAANTPEATSLEGLAQTDLSLSRQQENQVAGRLAPELTQPALQRA